MMTEGLIQAKSIIVAKGRTIRTAEAEAGSDDPLIATTASGGLCERVKTRWLVFRQDASTRTVQNRTVEAQEPWRTPVQALVAEAA